METEEAILALAALAQSTRLEVFRLLAKHEPDGLAAGDIARAGGASKHDVRSSVDLDARGPGVLTAPQPLYRLPCKSGPLSKRSTFSAQGLLWRSPRSLWAAN